MATKGQLSSNSPAFSAIAIIKSDSTDLLALGVRGLYVGGAGDVVVIGAFDTTNSGAGTAITFKAVPVGTILPIAVKRVMAATAATDIVGLL